MGNKNHVYSYNLDKPMFEDFHNFEQEFLKNPVMMPVDDKINPPTPFKPM